jgi:hypothetical protein
MPSANNRTVSSIINIVAFACFFPSLLKLNTSSSQSLRPVSFDLTHTCIITLVAQYVGLRGRGSSNTETSKAPDLNVPLKGPADIVQL